MQETAESADGEYFEQIRDELLRRADPGSKFVAIHHHQLIDSDADEFALVRRVQARLPGEVVLVARVQAGETIVDLPSPEVARMRFTYSPSASLPQLVVPVVLASLGAMPADADAILDTGADMTAIPSSLRRALGLVPVDLVTMRGALGEVWKSVATFVVQVRVAGGPWMDVKVVESPKS